MKEIFLIFIVVILFIYLQILIMAENSCSAFSMTPTNCHSGEIK